MDASSLPTADRVDWALPEINLALCDRCGTCVERCPTGAVEMGPAGPFIARPEDCTYCALCDAFCHQGAITCSFEIIWESDTEGDNDRRASVR